MGKASSAKKVARAARAGGRGRSAGNRQRNLLFPGAIGLIVVLGVGLIGFAANDRKNDESVAPALGDHWHAAYGIYVCDEFLPAIPEFENPEGIHTHSDGVIHIHPFTANATGNDATMGIFLEGAGIEMSDDELTVNGETYTEGEDTCGEGADEEDGELVLAQWKDVQSTDANPARIDSDFGDMHFDEDGEGYVIAFVPEDADIPKPDSAGNLAELGAADGGEVPDESGETTTTTAAEGGEPSDGATTTTAAEGGSTTTAGETTTTTAGG
jgi:hypothetical protein